MGFNLAKFTEKNVRWECINTLKNFIDPHKNLDDEVLYDLLSRFKDKYGLYLLFDCLKYLKIMKRSQFAKISCFHDVMERNNKPAIKL